MSANPGPATSDAPLIHVIDDDESLRNAMLRLLGAAGYEVRSYTSAGDFLLHPLADRAGCILVDLRMPGPSGLELQSALDARGFTLPVIFMTGHGDVASSVRAMKAGAVDFLTKPVERDTLFEALQRALAIDAAQRRRRAEEADLLMRFASLSAREREVFEQIVAGQLNKQIAFDLGLAERTVKAERAALMIKLGVGSAAELGKLGERLRTLSDS